MSLYATLFTSLVVMLPAAPSPEGAAGAGGGQAELVRVQQPEPAEAALQERSPFRLIAESFRARAANQVRIEQQMTIRISPRPQPVRPNMLMDLPGREVGPRFVERKMGKCLKASGIAGVQPDSGNRLLLFMRDQRIVSAQLERACRSRDFYSGFYLSRSNDGKLCIDRDTLLSRNGSNCRLTALRQLVESSD